MSRIMPLSFIRTPLKLVYYWLSLVRSTMGLVNIGHIREIHHSEFIDPEAVPILRLKITHRVRHPLLGNRAPLIVPIPGWKTKMHKRYTSENQGFLKTPEQAVLKSSSEARMSQTFSLQTCSTLRPTIQNKSQPLPSDTILPCAQLNSSSH